MFEVVSKVIFSCKINGRVWKEDEIPGWVYDDSSLLERSNGCRITILKIWDQQGENIVYKIKRTAQVHHEQQNRMIRLSRNPIHR